MNKIIFIQARSNSTRFPNKIYQPIQDKTVLEMLYQTASLVGQVAVLGTKNDRKLQRFCKKQKLHAVFPDVDEDNLMLRFDEASDHCDAFIRLTSDCPLIPKVWIEKAWNELDSTDYVTNVSPRTVIDGFDVQGISKKAFDYYQSVVFEEEHLFFELENNCHLQEKFLQKFTMKSLLLDERIILNPFHKENKLSLDTKEDYERIKSYCETK